MTASRGQKQIDRFKEAARRLETDEDEPAFKAKLAVIARQKPVADRPPEKKRSRSK